MAKPNHQFEKRQRELAKQKKKEEKRLRKLEKANEPDDGVTPADADGDAQETTADSTPADESVGEVVPEPVSE